MNNTGIIKPQIRETDFRVGAEGLVYKVVNPTGDWTPFLPTYEAQQKLIATQACVSFSGTNVIETLLKQMGISLNFSDRFLAKMSGTTVNGNTLQAVLDSFRNDGWLTEADYPFPDNMIWNKYYEDVPQYYKDKAKKNKEEATWEVKYEWFSINNCHPNLEALKVQLKQCPLQRATSYSSGLCNFEHATEVFKVDETGIYIFDSYNGGIVKNPLSYNMPALMKIIVQPKTILPTLIPPITKDLVFGMRDVEVKYAQQKLIKLGYLAKGLDTGYYYNLTQLAVKKFALDYKVASLAELLIVNGKRIGIKTRMKLNSL